MRIVIYGNEYQDEHLNDIEKLFKILSKYNVWIEIEKEFYDYLCGVLPSPPKVNDIISEKDNFSASVALSIGGDGTFLRTAQRVALRGIPILGINTGHLGYLADVSVTEMETMLDDLIHRLYKIECRSVIEVSNNAGIAIDHPYALNEIAILKQDTSSMIRMQTKINDIDLTTYVGDGLVVATPTGSTAYNLSVGGPILEPTSRNWVISPIAPHSLTMRPLVVNDDYRISIKTTSRVDAYRLSIDGRSFTMPDGATVLMRKATFSVKVIQPYNHNFTETLRNKLMWGIDKR